MSKEELVMLQKSATLLVNPLKPNEIFSKYFFPSKTLEYLGSGTPTLMFRLPCIPAEYNNYLYYFEDESANGMKDKIVEICEKPLDERNLFGERAIKFVNNEKNGTVQAKKIVDMLKRT